MSKPLTFRDIAYAGAGPVDAGVPGQDGKISAVHPYDGKTRWVWPDTRFCYRYEDAKTNAEGRGQMWLQAWVPQTDSEFADAKLSQQQADRMLDMYGRHVAHLFNPKTWTWRQRLALAALFLFSRGQ